MADKRKNICFVTTVDFSVKAFLIEHIKELSKYYRITVITNTNDLNFLQKENVKAVVINLNFSRKISFINDIACFIKLFLILLTGNYQAVHSVTPKAGLLAMLAASLAFIPVRIHTYTGQVWVLNSGIKRLAFKSIDRFIGLLATHNIIDSPSQRDFLISQRVISGGKAFVFGIGSIAGVNLFKFKKSVDQKKSVKSELCLPENAFVFIYLGRLVRDKGVLDLAEAFNHLNLKNTFLLFVGPDEGYYSEKIKSINHLNLNNLRFIDFTEEPSRYLSCADVLCLPSYREGFGSVIIEAAAIGIPAIASNIYGITDAIINHQTGILHEPSDVNGIRNAMVLLQSDPIYLAELGSNANIRAKKDFDSRKMTAEWVDFYGRIISKSF